MTLELSIVRSGHLDVTLDRDIDIFYAFAAKSLGISCIVEPVLGTLIILHLLASPVGNSVSFLLVLIFVIGLSRRFLQVNRFDKGECDEVFARL